MGPGSHSQGWDSELPLTLQLCIFAGPPSCPDRKTVLQHWTPTYVHTNVSFHEHVA